MPDASKLFPADRRAMEAADRLLAAEGIRRDPNLDYLCGVRAESGALIAVGGAYKNTLRCFAVSKDHQGEGLMNTVLTHLLEHENEQGYFDVYVYTKTSAARFFRDLGFYEIARVEDAFVFLENQPKGFASYLARLTRETEDFCAARAAAPSPPSAPVGAVVLNANPFTRGHQHLIEQAARACSLLHLFLVSEDASLFPFAVRRALVRAGTAHLPNVLLHESGPYIISSATFPSYFQKNEEDVSRGHARLDIAVFRKIAAALSITERYVGKEPFSAVTNLYNAVMRAELPKAGIACHIIPRLEEAGTPVSASHVRALLQAGRMDEVAPLVPKTTQDWLESPAARPVLARIAAAGDVRHH